MNRLTKTDTIEMGIYYGNTVEDCIRWYGKRSLLEIMRHYDLDDEILKEYHYKGLGFHKDNPNDKKTKIKKVTETPPKLTLDWYDVFPESDEDEFLNTWTPMSRTYGRYNVIN